MYYGDSDSGGSIYYIVNAGQTSSEAGYYEDSRSSMSPRSMSGRQDDELTGRLAPVVGGRVCPEVLVRYQNRCESSTPPSRHQAVEHTNQLRMCPE